MLLNDLAGYAVQRFNGVGRVDSLADIFWVIDSVFRFGQQPRQL